MFIIIERYVNVTFHRANLTVNLHKWQVYIQKSFNKRALKRGVLKQVDQDAAMPGFSQSASYC